MWMRNNREDPHSFTRLKAKPPPYFDPFFVAMQIRFDVWLRCSRELSAYGTRYVA